MKEEAIPAETVIYFSKLKKLLWLILYVPLAVILSYVLMLYLKPEFSYTYIFWLCMDLVMIYMAFDAIYSIIKNKPQLIINEEGVRLPPNGLDPWNTIWGEKIGIHGVKFKTPYLLYFSRGESRTFEMEGCDINVERLKKLMQHYRAKYNASNADITDNGVNWNMEEGYGGDSL